MISEVLIKELEKDVKSVEEFRNKLISDNLGLKYYDDFNALSSLLGKVEAIIKLSREGRI